MRDATATALAYARHQHALTGYEPDPERLCARWGIRVIPGRDNYATHGPPSIISQTPDHYAPRQRFTIFHEMSHVLIQRAGLEEAVKAEVGEEDGEAHLELVVNHMAGLLLMPDPLVQDAVQRYGLTPEAVLEIQSAARASFAAASRRFVGANEDALTTVFLSGAAYVLDVASSDPYNRLYRYDRLPDARAMFPDAALLTLPDRPRPRTVGVIVR